MDKKFYARWLVILRIRRKCQRALVQPIYNHFMDCSFAISEKTELITLARFLFDSENPAPKGFNKRMLSPHLKVEEYYPDGATVFTGPEIRWRRHNLSW